MEHSNEFCAKVTRSKSQNDFLIIKCSYSHRGKNYFRHLIYQHYTIGVKHKSIHIYPFQTSLLKDIKFNGLQLLPKYTSIHYETNIRICSMHVAFNIQLWILCYTLKMGHCLC